ncbi:MAG: tRNA pseudouridine(55) synthase TruB [Candidatus Andersenbacteria bacterium]
MPAAPSGFLAINKPKKWTSFDVVAKVRSITKIDKIGHAGTLDPFATGLLVIAINQATRLVEYLQGRDKTYRGQIQLGVTSDTDDQDGHKTPQTVSTPPAEPAVRLALARLTGPIQQVPPAYSALKVQGRRMYDLARRGVAVERKPRPVTVHELTLLSYQYPTLQIETRVSSGTYIRAIARDLGADLGTGGYLASLKRTRSGTINLADAYELNDITAERLSGLLLPLEIAVEHLIHLIPSAAELARLANGQTISAKGFSQKTKQNEVAIVTRRGELQMLVSLDRVSETFKLKKLFDRSLAR